MGPEDLADTADLWGATFSTDSATVRRGYERMAETGAYDETFESWGYVAPVVAAGLARSYVSLDARILDAACGSGLTGSALRDLGYRHLTGIDIAPKLLALAARTGAYEELRQVDMQDLPLPFEDGAYGAATFIGALTYFESSDILRELCRVVATGGHIVFTQRDDLMRDQHYDRQLDAIEQEGRWVRVLGTEPMPYLPNHPDYGSSIQVQYYVYRVA